MLSICLALYFGTGLINEMLPLICVGLFYGVLSKRFRMYLMCFVFITTLIASIMYATRLPMLLDQTVSIATTITEGQFIFNFSSPVSIQLPQLPNWVYKLLTIPLLGGAILFLFVTLPLMMLNIYFALTLFLYFETIGRTIHGVNFSALVNMAQDRVGIELLMRKITPALAGYFIFTMTLFAIVFPLLVYRVLKFMKFYERIPGVVG